MKQKALFLLVFLSFIPCIGFSQIDDLLPGISEMIDSKNMYVILALGPILGLIALKRKNKITALNKT